MFGFEALKLILSDGKISVSLYVYSETLFYTLTLSLDLFNVYFPHQLDMQNQAP